MTRRTWYCIHLLLPSQLQDLLIGQLVPLGFEGFEQMPDSVDAYVRSTRWDRPSVRRFRTILERFHAEFPAAPVHFTLRRVRDENWNKKWEAQAGIVRVTKRILIKPSWQRLPARDRGKIILHIDPKMSFGTGHHETTQLSLQLLEESMFTGATALDVGTGTGVLAIAAARLGARHVDAVDVDEWSVVNAKENIRRNRVERTVRIKRGSIAAVPRRRYDIIVANVDAPTLERLMAGLAGRVRARGVVILSGLLLTDLDRIRRHAARAGLQVGEIVRKNEWIAVLFWVR